jgi:hypothetical protein
MSFAHLDGQRTVNRLNTIDPKHAMGGNPMSEAPTAGPATVRVVITERLLCRDRQWSLIDGPTVTGALLAHRDFDQAQGTAPRAPRVTHDNHVRLKIGSGIYTVAVAKLSQKDRDFIKQLEKTLRQHTDSPSNQSAPARSSAQPPITPPAHAP